MASFQNSKFKIQKRRFKKLAYTPHAPAYCTGNMIALLHGWRLQSLPRGVGALPLALWRSQALAMGSARLIGIDADCKGRVRGEVFLLFPLKWGRNCADNPIPYAVHNENSSRLRDSHGLHVNHPTQSP